MTETIEETATHRVRVEYDPYPSEPEFDGGAPILRIESRGYGTRVEHLSYGGDRPHAHDAAVEAAVERWGGPNRDTWDLVEKYLRAFHGVRTIETYYSGDYWYVAYDSECFRNHHGILPDHPLSGMLDEWRAYVEGEVFFYIVEQRVKWRAVNPVTDDPDYAEYPDRDTWEEVECCGGYYGYQWAKEAAEEAFEQFKEDDSK